MASTKMIDIRRGMVLNMNGQLWYCLDRDLNTPGNWRAILYLKLKNLKTGSHHRRAGPPGRQGRRRVPRHEGLHTTRTRTATTTCSWTPRRSSRSRSAATWSAT